MLLYCMQSQLYFNYVVIAKCLYAVLKLRKNVGKRRSFIFVKKTTFPHIRNLKRENQCEFTCQCVSNTL